MEITDASGEDSILRNIEETRKLWTEQGEAKKHTKMLQPSTKVTSYINRSYQVYEF